MHDNKMDDLDQQILDRLIDNARMPFTEIAKELKVSAGTIHVRVKKLEDAGIIKGTTLNIDYDKVGYSFIAYVGVYMSKTSMSHQVIENLWKIPFITVVHVTTGKFNIFCKIRALNTQHAKDIIYQIDCLEGVSRSESMISLEESINDKTRLMKEIFKKSYY